jgi:hypothetical protein
LKKICGSCDPRVTVYHPPGAVGNQKIPKPGRGLFQRKNNHEEHEGSRRFLFLFPLCSSCPWWLKIFKILVVSRKRMGAGHRHLLSSAAKPPGFGEFFNREVEEVE